MKHTHSAGGVVVNEKDEVIVVNQGGKTWSLPKGHIDEGESSLEAATREIYEETGVSQLELVRELGSYERYKIGIDGGEDKSEMKTMKMFLFKTDQTELKSEETGIKPQWVKKEKVAELLTHPKDKEFFISVVDTL